MKRVLELRRAGVEPVLVFDGGKLPHKKQTEQDREESRRAAYSKALQLKAEGRAQEAFKHFARAVDVTPAMASLLITRLRALHFECIVAPYEADAQLAYLSRINYIAAAISEDSDLLVFGCAQVLYKFDAAGRAKLIRLQDVQNRRESAFAGWTHDRFVWVCILCGCDYMKSKIGNKTAYKIALKSENEAQISANVKAEIPFTYEPTFPQDFSKALLVFKHQRVYDPKSKSIVHLTPLNPESQLSIQSFSPNDHFLGPYPIHRPIDPELAVLIADGVIDPESMQRFDGEQVKLEKRKREVATLDRFLTVVKRPRVSQQVKSLSPDSQETEVKETDERPKGASKFFATVEKESPVPCVSLLKVVPLQFHFDARKEEEISTQTLENLKNLKCPEVRTVRVGLRAPA